MKRITAIVLSVLLCFLCGCSKAVDPYSSDTDGFFVTEIYEKISENTKKAVKDVYSAVQKSKSRITDFITIKPDLKTIKTDSLTAYSLLSENQKNFYSIMLTAINSLELRKIKITDYYNDSFSDMVIAHRALICDYPEIFWMPKTFSVISDEFGGVYLSFKDTYDNSSDTGYYGITKDERDSMQKEMESVAQTVLNSVNLLETDFDKELYIHDYICENTVYDLQSANSLDSAPQNVFTAYGALIEKKAVCEGYSKAFKYLCAKAGIPCSLVLGYYEETPHMWNIVNLSGNCYYVDVTFDDSSDVAVLHKYFNLTKTAISEDHIFDSELSSDKTYDSSQSFNFFIPDCDSTDMNYYNYTGSYISNDNSFGANAVLNAYETGKNFAELENRTGLRAEYAFGILRKTLRKQIRLSKFYKFSNSDTIVVVW